MAILKFPSTSNWRPPGLFWWILLINCCAITMSFPFKEEDKGVISLPPHFKVDDPEPTGYDANFGRRIFDEEEIVQQPSTLEEVIPSRVRKRILNTSVISERTIQIKDEENSNNSLNSGRAPPDKNSAGDPTTTPPTKNSAITTTQKPDITQSTSSPTSSSRAIIKYVSTVPPAPFGQRTTLLNGLKPGGLNPTRNPPLDEERKVTVRTVLRRPPLREGGQSVLDLKTTTLRSEMVRTPGNNTNIKESLLARVQGRLRARSTTPAPLTTSTEASTTTKATSSTTTTTTRSTSSTTATTTRESSSTTRPTSSTTRSTSSTTTSSTTVRPTSSTTARTTSSTTRLTTTVTTTTTEEALPETTKSEEDLEETTLFKIEDTEEPVVTETSVSMSQSEAAHKVVMTTAKNVDLLQDTTTISIEDETNRPKASPTKTNEGLTLERPDGLQKELLAAIRRKITNKKKEASKNETSSDEDDGIEVSPNAVGSTQHPPVFRPIPFPNQERSLPSNPRVKIFLRVPENEKGIKIPNYSHIQGKLARLNAAITEGLRNDQLKKLSEENQTTTTVKPRLGAYTTGTTSTTTSSTTTTSTTTISTTTTVTTTTSTASETEDPIIAEKTHTYLDILRKRVRLKETTVPTTIPSTTTSPPKTTQMVTNSSKDHPTSHLRPKEVTTTPKSEVKVAKTKLGDSVLVQEDSEEQERIIRNNVNLNQPSDESDSVIHDITGTTVYVVGVICIIPAAGLVAWIVRYVVKKRGMANSENGSETGLNCPISDEDMMQVNKLSNNNIVDPNNMVDNKRKSVILSHEQALELVLDEPNITDEKASVKEALVSSVWQISRQNLRFLTVLGEGNFGKVWKAEAENICGYEGTVLVAVKTTKEKAPDKEKTDLLQEMQIMQKIGHHPNVVTLLGVSIDKEPYLLVMEYVMYGKLLTHLREQRSKQSSLFHFTEDDLQQPSEDSTITAKDLTKYAYGVAKGMEYIESKQIIHRDLAARNILLDHTRCCKISDFGLSRNLGDTGSEMYEQKTKGALPIRWMAPESLYFSVFTPKSDVWSFGILMWEIVTLGSTPYPGMGAREVMKRVRDGYRLERPSHCHPDLYKIISKCWLGDMNKRPDFTELRLELAKLLEHQHGYIDLQNIPENKYYSMTQTSDEDEKL